MGHEFSFHGFIHDLQYNASHAMYPQDFLLRESIEFNEM